MLHGVPQNEPRRAQDDPKRGLRRPKTTLRGTQEAQKSGPESLDEKRPNQDDPKTVLDRPRADLPSSAAPPGLHLGGQNGTKTDPKTIKNRSEKSRGEKTDPRRSWIRLGRSWAVLGAILGRLGPQNRALAFGGARFFEKSLFRC